MKVFVINLDRDVDKMKSIDSQLKALGVEYERISAIYGKNLSVEQQRVAYSPFRWWCAIGRPIAPAEIGCALSHHSIYRRIVDENLPCACILEDDVALAPNFAQQRKFVEDNIQTSKKQLILLSDHSVEDRKDGTFVCSEGEPPNLQRTNNDLCSEGYCVTTRAAEALLKCNTPISVPLDHWGRLAKQGGIELYHAKPTVCNQKQNVFGTTTAAERTSVNDLPLPLYLMYKFKRLIGKTIDNTLIMLGK